MAEPKPQPVDNVVEATGVWTTSNDSTDRSIDANVAAEVGDGLCTLIKDLIRLGVLV